MNCKSLKDYLTFAGPAACLKPKKGLDKKIKNLFGTLNTRT